ncbi:flagellum-specific peptidoglycan hydrolase FlgJ [Rhizobium sp. PP-F2F-G38]|nr:flagellum-specific peptidoglycan hydrolase FlgJ [Rhizobium sp. PP-F2F-G38]
MRQLEEEKIPFRIFETYRSPERQQSLYAQGRTAPGKRVTKAPPWTSYHQYGLAVDVVLFFDGKWSWDTSGSHRSHWERLHEIARAHGMEPLSWELPHLQYAGTTMAKLRAGDYPPFGDDQWAENLSSATESWANRQPSAPPPMLFSRRPAVPAEVEETEAEGLETFGRLTDGGGDDIVEQPEQGLTETIIRGAQASERVWDVPASVSLAQFILESARGKRMPPGSKNPFGIKARPGEDSVLAMTREYRNGRMVTEQARFRKFSSIDEAFSRHGQLLATSRYYVKAMAFRHDPEAFCHALTGVYATDPRYGGSLVKLIQDYQLTQYDNLTAPTPDQHAEKASMGNPDPVLTALSMGTSGPRVKALQTALKAARYPVGAIDGEYGRLTRDAVLAFQADNNLAKTGVAEPVTLTLLDKAPVRPLEPMRQEATEADLKKDGSITIIEADKTRKLSWVASILGALGIGNSAIVTAHGPSTDTNVPAAFDSVGQLLSQISYVLADPASTGNSALLNGLSRVTSEIATSIRAGTPLNLNAIATQLKEIVPPNILEARPEIESLLTALTTPGVVAGHIPKTIIDLLPANLVDPGGLISAIASSLVPGFGGSAITLGIGIAAHYFANKTAEARLRGSSKRQQSQPLEDRASRWEQASKAALRPIWR